MAYEYLMIEENLDEQEKAILLEGYAKGNRYAVFIIIPFGNKAGWYNRILITGPAPMSSKLHDSILRQYRDESPLPEAIRRNVRISQHYKIHEDGTLSAAA